MFGSVTPIKEFRAKKFGWIGRCKYSMFEDGKISFRNPDNRLFAQFAMIIRGFNLSFWSEMKAKDKILAVITAIVVLCFLVLLALSITGKIGFLIVKSGSMEPRMPRGSLAVFYSSHIEGVRNGEIIVFSDSKSATTLVTHRAISKQLENGRVVIKTRGDNNSNADSSTVDSSNFTGKVACIIPFAGHIVGFVKTPVGLLITDVALVSLMVMVVLDKLKSSIRESFIETIKGIERDQENSFYENQIIDTEKMTLRQKTLKEERSG
jgi:signal peptidase